MPENIAIPFTLGSRMIASPTRSLDTLCWSLPDTLDGRMPALPEQAAGSHGLRVLSAPSDAVANLRKAFPGHVLGGQQEYQRRYIAMDGSYEDYLAQFSSKTRSTLRRKQRKLAKANDDLLDVREYRTASELEVFLSHAVPLSALTYQERLLDAGLPASDDAREEMRQLAGTDKLRAYLLFMGDRAVSYLYLPIEDTTVRYAFLGYDPDQARLSPGTVLQMAALERLFAEKRYDYFDFTEGDGAHKALFGTGSVECSNFLLLAATPANRVLLGALSAFDGSIAAAKAASERLGIAAKLRKLLRG